MIKLIKEEKIIVKDMRVSEEEDELWKRKKTRRRYRKKVKFDNEKKIKKQVKQTIKKNSPQKILFSRIKGKLPLQKK